MRKRRRATRLLNLAVAAVFTAAVLDIGLRGAGPLPPLGNAFNPGSGVYSSATEAAAKSEQLHIPGLIQPVHVVFEAGGAAHVSAANSHDLYLAVGYLHAKFRLFQMDLMRRQGEGYLSQIIGSKALPSDEFEDQLGLYRTAQTEWTQMKPSNPARQALLAYAAGVNAGIAEQEKTGTLPMMFKLLAYQPAEWTPVDTLVVQGDMTQNLDFSTGPLEYALLVHSLGYARTMKWFPIVPANELHPYDLGPYHKDPAVPMSPVSSTLTAQDTVPVSEVKAATAVTTRVVNLPKTAIRQSSDSNNWVVDGTKTASGKPLMAGDPHLDLTLPSIWYQIEEKAPGVDASGVSIPGTPVVLIGRNQHISWSLTNTQNQATLYYKEKTDSAHPNQYFWNGKWRPMKLYTYDIPVKGEPTHRITVKVTVHGPILTQSGQTLAVDWMGNMPSPDMEVMMKIDRASNFAAFKNALRNWHAPTQNFVYADGKGNIGLISAGYYPLVKHGQPWLPLSGTGEDDIVGTIPFSDVPQVYNPPTHMAFTSNQREVGASYPYYIGNSLDFFDVGYRADEVYHTLSASDKLTVADMEKLQNDNHDYLARVIVPVLSKVLKTASLSPEERQVADSLAHWDMNVTPNSTDATVWLAFWQQYVNTTFGPWWDTASVPVDLDKELTLDISQGSSAGAVLTEDLQQWTLHDTRNPAFTAPGGSKENAATVMLRAFHQTIAQLSQELGPNPKAWLWNKVQSREIPSLAQIPSLGYGPVPTGGDLWTVDAVDGVGVATAGPSWRMIVDWSTGESIGVYPGGQSEDPLSRWYENHIAAWTNGKYVPMLPFAKASRASGRVDWNLQP